MNNITFSSDGKGFTKKDTDVTEKMVREYFKTEEDQEQMPTSKKFQSWILKHCKHYLSIIKDGRKVVGFTFMLPTTKRLMKEFINKKINEKELITTITKTRLPLKPQAFYLCSTIVQEEYRGKGLAYTAKIKLLQRFLPLKPVLYAWPFSKEGKHLARKIAKNTHLELYLRKD